MPSNVMRPKLGHLRPQLGLRRYGTALLAVGAAINLVALSATLVLFIRAQNASPVPQYPPSSVTLETALRNINAPHGITPDGEYYIGDTSAPITVVEYLDYQCPACASFFHQAEPRLMEEYVEAGHVRLIVRDLPLNIHHNATPAAVAARCAGVQDRYWDMHDLLLSRQIEWERDPNFRPRMIAYADELGLDADEFKECIDDASMQIAVHESGGRARADGVTSTPSLFVDGARVETRDLFVRLEQRISSHEHE